MKKKFLSLCLVMALSATALIGGTLAYFTDNDAKTNTFTMGDVKIHIDEWMNMDGDGTWEAYTDKQELAPIAQSKAPFNKLVETVNDGSEDAYIRTFITCPVADYWDLGYGFNSGANAKDGTAMNGTGTMHYLDKWTDLGKTTLANGEEVYIFMCEHYDAIPAGDSILSLTKVWVYDTVDNDAVSENFEVKVYSEAIQSANLSYEEAMASLNNGKTDLEHAAELFNNK